MRSILHLLLCSVLLLLSACNGGSSTASRPPADPPSDSPPDRYALYKALQAPANTTERVLYWNGAMSAANAIDHAFGLPGEPAAADQFGPTRSSRAFAIVHIAMFDAINAVRQQYPSYSGIAPAPSGTSEDTAVAQAAHDTLVSLYPQQASVLDQLLAQDLARVPDSDGKANGVQAGQRAAAAILALRANDGAEAPDPVVGVDYIPSIEPGMWRPDPVSNSPLAVGAYWGKVLPFVVPSVDAFKAPPPPALTSAAYTEAFNEVKRLGGDGITTPTERTPEQTLIGIFWGYDATPFVGTRPRQYNQVAVTIARQRTTDALEMAHLLAMVNAAIADSCMVAWYDKYGDEFWRPVTAVREAGTDGNPDTQADPTFTPLGSPATNAPGMPNFTPPFPGYPSGHAVLGSATFEILRSFYGTDQIAFTLVSDELNGVNRDNHGNVRPLVPRSFATLTDAEQDNGVSRVYLGVHFRFDVDNGMAVGRRVADDVFKRGLVQPDACGCGGGK
jgi:hypothetical protein